MAKSKHDHGDYEREHFRAFDVIEYSPALLPREKRHADRRPRENQSQQNGIQGGDGEIAAPSLRSRQLERTLRRLEFPQAHDREHTGEKRQADRGFVADNEFLHVFTPIAESL